MCTQGILAQVYMTHLCSFYLSLGISLEPVLISREMTTDSYCCISKHLNTF
uniref:Uncharacterized protein n=1 Tax=Anguilla anguilla TaxID=7936 RepID=A0A0E9SSK7_ANGAN